MKNMTPTRPAYKRDAIKTWAGEMRAITAKRSKSLSWGETGKGQRSKHQYHNMKHKQEKRTWKNSHHLAAYGMKTSGWPLTSLFLLLWDDGGQSRRPKHASVSFPFKYLKFLVNILGACSKPEDRSFYNSKMLLRSKQTIYISYQNLCLARTKRARVGVYE